MRAGTGHRPHDFAFRYAWREGSVPPPDHTEYTISVPPAGEGTIVFRPDYPEHGAPAWEERFRIPEPRLDELYALMVARGTLAAGWESWEGDPDAPVGGSLEWLEVTAGGERHTVPSALRHPEAVEPVYAFIRALVPDALWANLRARHDAYHAAHGER